MKKTLIIFTLLASIISYANADDGTNIYDMIADKAKSTSMNGSFSGPMASLNRLPPHQKSCMFLCGMTLAAPSPPPSRAEETQTCLAACYSKSLDEGDADKEKYRDLAMEHYNKAKDLGSQFPPPTFEK